MPYNLPEDHPGFIFIPFEQAEKQPKVMLNGGIYRVIEDHWWIVHPEKGLIVYINEAGQRVPQCNPHEEITKTMVKELMGDWAEAREIPIAYIRDDL